MAAPAFVGAGSGAERLTTGSATASKTGCTAGNLLICHLHVKGLTGDWSGWNSAVNIQSLDGVTSSTTNLRGGTEFQINVGRVTTDGTCSANFGSGASGEDVAARIYEFSGAATGSTLASVFENGAGLTDAAGGTGTSFQDGPVVTNGTDRLALNIGALETAQAVGSFTGESGGDWTETVAEYMGTTITLQMQSATLASPGSLDGGSFAVSSTVWLSITTALIPPAPAGPGGQASMMLLGVG